MFLRASNQLIKVKRNEIWNRGSPKSPNLRIIIIIFVSSPQGWVLTCIFFVFGSLLEYSVILLHLKIYSLSLALPNSSGTMMNTQALMSAALPATNAMSGNGTTGTVNHHRMETGPSHKSCFQREGFFHSRRGWFI